MSDQTTVAGTPGKLADPEERRALMAGVSPEPGSRGTPAISSTRAWGSA